MTLKDQITEDMKTAMRAKDSERLGTIRLLLAACKQREVDERGEPNVGLIVPVLNLHAYLLGALSIGMPNWVAVSTTVCAVLLLTGRERLHDLAHRVEMKEITTAGQFLVLAGIVLPLLPNSPVTPLTTITPRQAWLALVVVCTLSYASYLAQHYWVPASRGLWMAALGGLYSSTAMTVVLARQIAGQATDGRRAQAGITLATGVMYLRILAIVAVFNFGLVRALAFNLGALALLAFLVTLLLYRHGEPTSDSPHEASGGNPLEFGAATAFTVLFVVTSVLSAWVRGHFGAAGIYTLTAIVGVTDIDPFVLNLAQGGTSGMSDTAMAAAVLIAVSSNNLLKAAYTVSFAGGRAAASSALALVGLACCGVAAALYGPAGILPAWSP